MYNGIGLQTARGSGTNGYVQSNKFFLRAKTNRVATQGKGFDLGQGTAGVTRKPNKEILEHDRKRQIELKLVVLEDKLTDQGYTDAEIAEKLDETRRTLEAAAASEAAAGVSAIVVGDKRVSDTQTHQIAARKEKQMETLKAALGIRSDVDDEKKQADAPYPDYDESNDDEKLGNVNLENDDMTRGQVSKQQKKKDTKIRGHKDSSDTDSSSGKPVRVTKKKHQKIRAKDSEDDNSSDSDNSRRHAKESRKKQRKSGRNDSEDESDVDIRKNKQKLVGKHRKSRRYDTEDSDSDSSGSSGSDDDTYRHDKVSKRGTQNMEELFRRSRRHDSVDDSDADRREENKRSYKQEKVDNVRSDYKSTKSLEQGKGGQRYDDVKRESDYEKLTKRKQEKLEKSRRYDTKKHESDTDDEKLKNIRRRRHDSYEDASSDDKSEDSGKRGNVSDSDNDTWEVGKMRSLDKCRKIDLRGRSGKARKAVAAETEDRRKETKHKQEEPQKIRKRRNDSDEDSRGNASDDSETDTSDYRHEKNETIKFSDKNRRVRGIDSKDRGGQKGDIECEGRIKEKDRPCKTDDGLDIFRKLEELSRKDTTDRSSYRSRDITRGSRKSDDERKGEHPTESRSRGVASGKEIERGRDLQKDIKIESETRSHRNRDDQRRSGREREGEKPECGTRIKNWGESHREIRRDNRDYEEDHDRVEDRRGRKHRRDEEDELQGKKHKIDKEENEEVRKQSQHEEDRRGRKHKRYEEEEAYNKHDSVMEYERGKHGGHEERGNRRHEKDGQSVDPPKRARYGDSHSSERYESDKRGDGRVRR